MYLKPRKAYDKKYYLIFINYFFKVKTPIVNFIAFVLCNLLPGKTNAQTGQKFKVEIGK